MGVASFIAHLGNGTSRCGGALWWYCRVVPYAARLDAVASCISERHAVFGPRHTGTRVGARVPV